MQSLEFNGAVKLKDSDGDLWFGGINGINRFNPQTIPEQRGEAKVALTGYKIAGKHHTILDLSRPPPIVMNYGEQLVSFEVTSLDFSYTGKNRFSYFLEGFDHQWHQLPRVMRLHLPILIPVNMCFMYATHCNITVKAHKPF